MVMRRRTSLLKPSAFYSLLFFFPLKKYGFAKKPFHKKKMEKERKKEGRKKTIEDLVRTPNITFIGTQDNCISNLSVSFCFGVRVFGE